MHHTYKLPPVSLQIHQVSRATHGTSKKGNFSALYRTISIQFFFPTVIDSVKLTSVYDYFET
jgi:hypothetical protein